MPWADECVCPNSLLRLRCTAVGMLGTTVWTVGQQCNIGLDHAQFMAGVNRSCTRMEHGLSATGNSLGVDGDCYTSQLTIMVTPDLNGTNVTCEHFTTDTEHIGYYQILTSGR